VKYEGDDVLISEFQKNLPAISVQSLSSITCLRLQKFDTMINFDVILNNTPNLEILDLSENTRYYKKIDSFLNCFVPGKLEKLKYFDFSVEKIPNYCLQNLYDYDLDDAPFDLFGEGIGSDALIRILKFVETHKNLTHVNLSEHHCFSEKATQSLMDVIMKNTKLEVLKVSDSYMCSPFTFQIVNSLRWNSTLKIVNLKTCYVNQKVRDEVRNILEMNKNLQIFIRDE
jgi:Ran GTPase-activating protein (RanGAP) involved in mRNA processing and transport